MHLVNRWVWLAAFALVLGGTALGAPEGPHRERRSFFDLQCKGVYDSSIFARLDRLCDDCHNLFREPQLYNLCREKCFTTPYFKACVDSLYLNEDEEQFSRLVDYVGKR